MPDTAELERSLRRVTPFHDLPTPAIRAVAESARLRFVPAEATLFVEGELSGALYILLAGGVKLLLTSPEGRELTVRLCVPVTAFNWEAAFDGAEAAVTARTVAPCRLAVVPACTLRHLVEEHPALGAALLESLAAELRGTLRAVRLLSFRPVTARLADLLLARTGGQPGAVVRLSQQELASMVGTVRQVLRRSLADLERSGAVAVSRCEIRILDPHRLRSLVEADLPPRLGHVGTHGTVRHRS